MVFYKNRFIINNIKLQANCLIRIHLAHVGECALINIIDLLVLRVADTLAIEMSSSQLEITIPEFVATRQLFERSLIDQVDGYPVGGTAGFRFELDVPNPRFQIVRIANAVLFERQVLVFEKHHRA